MRALRRILPVVAALCLLASQPVPAQQPLTIHFISGSNEYESEASLKSYRQTLESQYHVEVTASWVQDRATDLPGIEHVPDADLLLVFARRMELPPAQMETVANHWEQGKPIVGIRTASHAFRDDTNQIFDHEVMGGNYSGHFGDEPVTVRNLVDHPVLEGVGNFTSQRMYTAGRLAADTQVLQTGTIPSDSTHAVTWVHTYNGGRTFYTSLGVPEDFENEEFVQMITNAVFWTTRRDPEKMRR